MNIFDKQDYEQTYGYIRRGDCSIIGTALALGLGLGAAAAGVGGSAIAAHGASSAADAQAQAANNAAQLQHEDAQQALQFQQGQYSNAQQELAPYANVGYSSIANLASLLGILPPSSTSPATTAVDQNARPGLQAPLLTSTQDFTLPPAYRGATGIGVPQETAPLSSGALNVGNTGTNNGGAGTPASYGVNIPSNLSNLVNLKLGAPGSLLQPFNGITMQNDPGYQFRLDQANRQIQNSAAARGDLLSGNTLQALNQFGQDYASNEYNNAYNRYVNDQSNTFNRLAALAGFGQTATNTGISAGNTAANNISNTLLASGQQIGQNINNAGAARATGYLNTGNILGNSVAGIGANIPNLLMLRNILNQSGGIDATSGIVNNWSLG